MHCSSLIFIFLFVPKVAIWILHVNIQKIIIEITTFYNFKLHINLVTKSTCIKQIMNHLKYP